MTAASTITSVGTQDNVIATVDGVAVTTGTETVVGNYLVTTANGLLTVNPKKVTITANDASKTYDGSALTQPGFTASALEEGDTHTFTVVMTAASTITDAGTKPNVIATVDGVAVTTGTETVVGNYLVTTANGTLTISRKAVTIKAKDASKTYDSSALTQPEFTASALEEGDIHTFTVVMTEDSTITNVGTKPNVIATVDDIAVTTGTETVVGNYLVTTVEGTLTITNDNNAIIITSATTAWTYDSKLHKDETYMVTYGGETVAADEDEESAGKIFTLTNGDIITITATAAGVTNVSDNAEKNNTYTYTIKNGEGTDTSGNYSSITANVGTLSINRKSVTITAEGASKTYDGSALTESGFTTSGLEEGDTHTFTVVMTEASTITNVGTKPNVIATVDDVAVTTGTETAVGNYLVTTVNGTLKIDPKKVTITANDASKTYDGSALTESGFTATALESGDTHTFTVVMTAASTITNVGTQANVIATVDGEAVTAGTETAVGNYLVTTVNGTLKIDPKKVTITAEDAEKTYDGKALTQPGFTASALESGDTHTFTVVMTEASTITNIGTQANVIATVDGEAVTTGTETAVGNYLVTTENGELKVNPKKVTITANDAKKTYDGSALTESGFTASDLESGDRHTFAVVMTADSTITNVGTQPNVIATVDGVAVTTGTETAVGNYLVTTVNGELKIEKANLTVTITGNNASKPYNGSEQSVTGYKISIPQGATLTEGEIKGPEQTAAIAKGTNVDGGDNPDKTYPMGLTVDNFSTENGNYNVTFTVEDGWLKITPLETEVIVTITGHNDTKDYDGTEYSVSGYDVSINNDLYKEADFTFNGNAEAKRTNVVEGTDTDGKTDMGLNPDQFTNKNINFQTVTFKVTDGFQKINPIDVTVRIIGKSNTAPYDGKEHEVTGYTAIAENQLYDVEKDFTFSGSAKAKRTDVVEGTDTDGKTDMGLTESQFKNTNSNFGTVTFNIQDGYQEIEPIKVTVTITGHNNTTSYDGKEHVVKGYDVEISNPLYTEKDFTFNSTSEAKRTNVVEGEDTDGKTEMGLNADQFKNTNTNFDTVTFNVTDGYQIINPINVTVTIMGNYNAITFDGDEHIVTGFTATADSNLYKVEGDPVDFNFNGTAEAKRTDEGTTYMGLEDTMFSNKNTNFATVTFKVTDGYQTIVPIGEVLVTITGHNNTASYDGKEHVVKGYDVEISDPLYTEKDFTFSGTSEAKRTNVEEGEDTDGKTDMGLNKDQFENTSPNFTTVTFKVTDGYQIITPIDATVTITGKNNSTEYDGNEHSVSGYDVKIEGNLYKETDFTFTGTAEAKRTNVVEGEDTDGQTNMGLKDDQFTNQNTNFKTVIFKVTDGYQKITPIDVTVTIVGNQHTTDYDGEKHSVVGFTAKANSDLYSVEKEKEDFAFSGQALATRKDAGTTNMGLTEEQFTNKNTNFGTVTFKVTDGYQTINPIEATVTIVGANSTAPYDKKAHTVTGYTATADTELYDVLKDFTFGGTDSATRTDVGTTYMGLKDNQFTNVSANFKKVTFEVTDGYQKIEAIEVTVTITGKNATVTYDGKEHTVSGYNINSSNDLYTAADFTFSGSSELKEKNAGTYTMDLDAKDFKNTNDNFVVTFVIAENGDGKLVIDPKPITIKADDKTKVYGDKDPELTATIIGLVDGDSIDGDYIVSREKGEDVGEYKITISLPTIEQGAVFTLFKSAQPAASNYEIATEDGTFTITKAPLTISTESATKQYDGTALTKEGATITGLVKGETATVTATGKQTEVGSSSNTYTIVWDTAKESNYAITEQLGTLTVTETAVVPDNPPAPGVKTGDNTPITLWIVAFAVSATLIILLLILVIKRRKERE